MLYNMLMPAADNLESSPIFDMNEAEADETTHHFTGQLIGGAGVILAVVSLMAATRTSHETPAAPLPISCRATSAQDLATVTALFNQPPVAIPNSVRTTQQLVLFERTAVKQAAERFGLTFPEPSIQDGSDLVSSNPAKPITIKQTLPFVNRYLQPYGVDVSIGSAASVGENNGVMPTAKDLRQTNATYMPLWIMSDISRLPVQEVQASGVKHIVLAAHLSKAAAYAATETPEHDAIVADVDGNLSAGTFDHEISHFLSEEACGGPTPDNNDPQYDQYNNGVPYLPSGETLGKYLPYVPPSYEGAQDHFLDDPALPTNYCGGWKKVLTRLVGMTKVSDYSNTDVMEDKAEMSRAIILDQNSELFNPLEPQITKKALLLLARWYKQDPAYVRWLAFRKVNEGQIPGNC